MYKIKRKIQRKIVRDLQYREDFQKLEEEWKRAGRIPIFGVFLQIRITNKMKKLTAEFEKKL